MADYAEMVRAATEAAAGKTRRRHPTQPDRIDQEMIADLVIPKSPLALGLTIASLNPAGLAARLGLTAGKRLAAGAAGLLFEPSEAQGGPLEAARKIAKRAFGGSDVRAPTVMPSAFDRPLFDYSRLADVPDVPQFDLPRYVPARGVPEAALALDNPENVARVNAIVEQGMKHGGLEWYNTMPLRAGWVGELGAEKGVPYYNTYLGYTGAVSPRSKVPQNVRTASYYQMLDEFGLPQPQPVKKISASGGVNWSLPKGELPEGYGGLAQALHAQNAQIIRANQGNWPMDPAILFEKPKPPSFTENLLGNYRPVTADVHNTHMWGFVDPAGTAIDQPPKNVYPFSERIQQREAANLGIAPAQYQASGWIPWAAEATGNPISTYSRPFIGTVEDRVKATAREYGWSPEQTLRLFYRRQIPIALAGGAVLPAALDAASE